MIHLGGCCQEKPGPDSLTRLNGQTFKSLMAFNPLQRVLPWKQFMFFTQPYRWNTDERHRESERSSF